MTNGKRTLCEIWLRRAVPSGLLRSVGHRDSTLSRPDRWWGSFGFRENERLPQAGNRRGVYTLRYGLQPVDGNHVGTSETRDFLLLSPAGEDKDPAKLEVENLYKFSRDASETTHPAILPMQGVVSDFDAETAPVLVHDDSPNCGAL